MIAYGTLPQFSWEFPTLPYLDKQVKFFVGFLILGEYVIFLQTHNRIAYTASLKSFQTPTVDKIVQILQFFLL